MNYKIIIYSLIILSGFGCRNTKLPITIPRSVGHIPAYYNHKPSSYYRKYKFEESTPLFHFGYGLSYSNFKYDNLRISEHVINKEESTKVQIDVTNVSNRAGKEIVQLYIRDIYSSVTRPVKELKDFQKHTFMPGEKKTITFKLRPDPLAFYDKEMKWTIEPGDFEIMIGSSSEEYLAKTITVR